MGHSTYEVISKHSVQFSPMDVWQVTYNTAEMSRGMSPVPYSWRSHWWILKNLLWMLTAKN